MPTAEYMPSSVRKVHGHRQLGGLYIHLQQTCGRPDPWLSAGRSSHKRHRCQCHVTRTRPQLHFKFAHHSIGVLRTSECQAH